MLLSSTTSTSAPQLCEPAISTRRRPTIENTEMLCNFFFPSFLTTFSFSFFLSSFYGTDKKLRSPFQIACSRPYWQNADKEIQALSHGKFLQYLKKKDGSYNWEWRQCSAKMDSIFSKLPPSLSLAVFLQVLRERGYSLSYFPVWVIFFTLVSIFSFFRLHSVFVIFFFRPRYFSHVFSIS